MTHLLLAVIYLSFISLGLPDALLGSAWPTMYPQLDVPVSYAGIVSMVISVGTIVSSLQSDRLTRRFGPGRVTAASVCLTAAALFGFSVSSSFWMLCLWAIPYGLGAGSVDAALNNYVALHYASRHMSWLHCMWGVGATAGPYIMGFALAGGQGWNMGYRAVGLLQLLLTALLIVTLPLWRRTGADAVIVATGGCSYPSTGSTGDGYRFARECGHQVTELRPALVPFETGEPWVKDLQGLSLRNVRVRIRTGKKVLYEEFGEMLFTHYGVSGPLILSASSLVSGRMEQFPMSMEIDLKPAMTPEQLDRRILRDFEENRNRQFKNGVQKLFPGKLLPVMVSLSGIHPDKKINEITREERRNFAALIKSLPMTLTGLRDFNEAIITRGGVSVKEINPSTMESRLVQGLYFAGEVLDVDALTGGFNLQIAWSTGYLAGDSVR